MIKNIIILLFNLIKLVQSGHFLNYNNIHNSGIKINTKTTKHVSYKKIINNYQTEHSCIFS